MSSTRSHWRTVAVVASVSFALVFTSVAAVGLLTLQKWPIQIDTPYEGFGFGANLVIDQSDVLHTVYAGHLGDQYALIHAEGSGDNWTRTSICPIDPSNHPGFISLVTDREGHAYLCAPAVNETGWYQGSILYATDSVGVWSLTTAYDFAGDYRDSMIAVDSRGAPHIIFDYGVAVDPNTTNLAIGHLQLVDGNWNFSNIALPSNYSLTTYHTLPSNYSVFMSQTGIRSAEFGPNGDLQLTYVLQKYGGDPAWYWLNISETGTAFVRIDFGAISPAFGTTARLAVDSSGSVHMCYIGVTLSGCGLYYASNETGTWNASLVCPVDLGPITIKYADLSMFLDGEGKAHVCAFSHYTNRGPTLVYANDVNGTWRVETVRRSVSEQSPGSNMALAIDSEGRAHVLFHDLSSGDLVVATDKPDPLLVLAAFVNAVYWAAVAGSLAVGTSVLVVKALRRSRQGELPPESGAAETKDSPRKGV